VLTVEPSAAVVVLQRRGTGPSWRVEADGRSWTTVGSSTGPLDVLRLPGQPSARWSATVDGVLVPARDSSAVTELGRPRDAMAERPLLWLTVALLAAIVVGLNGYHTAGKRALRATLRSIGFGLLTLFGVLSLVDQLHRHAPNSPGLLGAAVTLAPLAALAAAAITARRLTARIPTEGDPPRWLRLATGMALVVLVALLAYAAEITAVRYLPGL
jgi:hypothetical protein